MNRLLIAGLALALGLAPASAATLAVTPGSGAVLGQGTDGTNLLGASIICGATATVTLYATCVNQAIVNASGQFLTLTTLTGSLPAFAATPTVNLGTIGTAATAANQEVTAAGTTATSGQGVQGLSGGVPIPERAGPYVSAGAGQYGVSISSSTALIVASGALFAQVCVEAAAARYTDDGITTPTASTGIPVAAGSCWQVSGPTLLAALKFQGTGASIDVSYYK